MKSSIWPLLLAWPCSAAPVAAQPRAAEPSAAAAEPATEPGEPAPSWVVPSAHALGLMAAMRVGEAVIWPDPFADLGWARLGSSYAAAYTRPPKWDGSESAFEWDGDPWAVNVVGHGLFGSELFMRMRSCGHGVPASLLFTAAGSTFWEYGVEASGVRPSALDLWYTPLAGLVLGELRYQGWRAARGLGDRSLGRVLMIVLDPLGELERAAGTRC